MPAPSSLWKALLALLLAWLWLLPGHAQTSTGLQPVPELSGRVVDLSATLTAADRQALTQELQTLEDGTGAQVVVLMVPTTAPEDIAAYAIRVARAWKIGRKDVGDGVLVIVAKNDRRMRIEVARRLEGAIPDIRAAQIIDQAMKPRFRQDDYAGGLSAAIGQLSLLIRGEKLPAPATRQPASARAWSEQADFLIPALFFGFPLAIALARSIFGRGVGSLIVAGIAGVAAYALTTSVLIAGIAGLLGLLLTLLSNLSRGSAVGPYIGSGGWRSGGSGRSSGGGGFRSGGGGSFGGGGASGGW